MGISFIVPYAAASRCNVHRWEGGYTQDFLGGSDGRGAIMKSDANNNSYWVGGDFWNKFLDTGGAGGILGYPTSDDYSTNGGLRQDFQGGALLQSSNGIFPIFGGVGYQYLHFEGGEKGRLGFPTSGEIGLGNGVIIQNFEHGYILYGSGPTRTVINGSEIAVGYDGNGVNSTFTDTFDRGGGWNALGSASNNVHRWEGGYTQDFSGGSDSRGAIMKSDANNNSYWVGGDFWNKFLDTGGAGGILGYATSDRYSTNGGLRQDFQGGAIFKTSNGIFSVYGGIGSYYFGTLNGETGQLGFPTSGENGIGNGVIRQNFENGYILWNGNATAYHNDGTPLFGGSNGGSGSGSTIGIPVDFNSSVYSSDNPFWRAGYGGSNCTWYVNGRLKELGYRASVLDGMLGNAHLWDNQAPGAGATVSNQVQVGAIAVWESNHGGAEELGHVAVVEQINPDGSILISESNWSGKMYNTRTISPNTFNWPDHFILVPKDSTSDNPVDDNSGGDISNNDVLLADPTKYTAISRSNDSKWRLSDVGNDFNTWSDMKKIPGVEVLAQKAEDFLWNLFAPLGLLNANRHLKHFLTQGQNPEPINNIPVDEMLLYIPSFKELYDQGIRRAEQIVENLWSDMHKDGKRPTPDSYWITPAVDGTGFSPGFNLRTLVNIESALKSDIFAEKLLDFYCVLGKFDYDTSAKLTVHENNSNFTLEVQMEIHDYFNFDTKIFETIQAYAMKKDKEVADGIGRFIQSFAPETLVRLGMANNYEQWGTSSITKYEGKFNDDGTITWLI